MLFYSKKETTSATICANCGLEKMLHTIGEGIKVSKIELFNYAQMEHQIEMDDEEDAMWEDEDNFQCCDNCDLPDACADFGCAIKHGIQKVRGW